MISTEEKELIIEILGKHYSSKVIEEFERLGFKPVRAIKFQQNYIHQLVNGNYENEVHEFALLNFVKRKKKEKIQLKKKRKQLTK